MSPVEKKSIREVKTGETRPCTGCVNLFLDDEAKRHFCDHPAVVAEYGGKTAMESANQRPLWCPREKKGKG